VGIDILYPSNNRRLTEQSRPTKQPFLLITAVDFAVVLVVFVFDIFLGQCYRALTFSIIQACIKRGRKWCGVCGAMA
jgi:hypothetical protein